MLWEGIPTHEQAKVHIILYELMNTDSITSLKSDMSENLVLTNTSKNLHRTKMMFWDIPLQR